MLNNHENSHDLTMEGMNFSLPAEKNIINRALSVFRAKTGFSKGIAIRAEKRIPVGGGLGGGSSNAAYALLAFNKLAGSPLDKNALLELGSALGSDVPFFIYETAAAWVTGRGEFINPLNNIPQLFFVLVNPGFQSDTASAFRLLDEYRKNPRYDAGIPSSKNENNLFPGIQEIGSWLKYRNDFLQVFDEKERSVYNEIIFQLTEQGAVYANLSGAGSTCFGVFNNIEQAQKTAQVLRERWPFVQECGLLENTILST